MRTKAAICSVPLAAAAGKRRAHADTHASAKQGPPSTQRQRAPFKGTWSVRADTKARLDAVDSFSFSLFLVEKNAIGEILQCTMLEWEHVDRECKKNKLNSMEPKEDKFLHCTKRYPQLVLLTCLHS